jgi:hypothetical protein
MTTKQKFRTGGKTIPQVRAWTRTQLINQTGDATGTTVEWVEPLRRITYPTGLRGIYGRVRVSAPGWKAQTMTVTSDAYGSAVR